MSNIHTILLKKSEEKRLDDLFNQYSKSENNVLKFNEFLMLALDRSMLSNRFGLKCFYDNYLKALESEIKPPISATASPSKIPGQFVKPELKFDVFFIFFLI